MAKQLGASIFSSKMVKQYKVEVLELGIMTPWGVVGGWPAKLLGCVGAADCRAEAVLQELRAMDAVSTHPPQVVFSNV